MQLHHTNNDEDPHRCAVRTEFCLRVKNLFSSFLGDYLRDKICFSRAKLQPIQQHYNERRLVGVGGGAENI